MIERDFSKVQFKVNCSGSWANLVECNVDDIDEVKSACMTIAKAASGSRIKFKYVDAESGTIEECSYLTNGIHGYAWYEPRRR